MNNKNTIIIIFLLVLGLIGTGFLVRNMSTSTTDDSEVAVETSVEAPEDAMEAEESMEAMMEVPEMTETALNFENFSGEVNYSVQKRFFSKADDVVTGTAEDVSGSGWFDPETGSFYVEAELDFTDLATDNAKRDEDILPIFETTEIMIKASAEEDERIVLGEEVTIDVPVMLTINGVTRSEVFEVTTTVTETSFEASGSAPLVMSDYEIVAPSLIEVFSVDDSFEVSFDVSGEAAAMMEKEEETQ